MANDNRIHKMQQQFTELRQAIASDFDERFQTSESRLREGLSKDLDTKLDAREQRLRQGLSKDLDTKLDAREQRLREGLSKDLDDGFAASERRLTDNLTQVIVQQLETAQQHLEGRLQVHMEDLKGLVTSTAEGYGATLDRIEGDLGELNKKFDSRFSDHAKALANHNQRLVTLERSRRASQRRGPKG